LRQSRWKRHDEQWTSIGVDLDVAARTSLQETWLQEPSCKNLAARTWLQEPGCKNLAARTWLKEHG
jgi:hypothetical protein